MKQFTVLIKPASSLCNLRCQYCFYHSIADRREQASYGVMSDETMRQLIQKALDCAPNITFSFQGGEPTLATLPFFTRFIREVKKANTQGAHVQYALQTNGMDMTEEFAAFFGENRFLLGLSLDGPKDINDWMRVDASGKGVFSRVMHTAELLRAQKVDFNILTVVTGHVARHIEQIYRFMRRQDFSYLQFIPCLDPLGAEPGSLKHSLTPKAYEEFLLRLFRLWADDVEAGRGISIRFFDNLLSVAAGYPSEQCGMQGRCPGQFVVEGDGSLFPCDFYCVDNWRIGSIHEMTFEQAFHSPVMQKFIATSIDENSRCRECPYYALCHGGCRRDRDPALDGRAGPNLYCDALKAFFAEATPRLSALLRRMGANAI